MDPTKTVEAAMAVARTKKAIADAVRGIDPGVVRAALAQALVEVLDDPSPAIAPPARVKPPHFDRPASEQTAPTSATPPTVQRGTNGAPGNIKHGSRTATMLMALAQHPRMPIAELAFAVYRSREKVAQNNVRSLLDAQKKAGRVRNVGAGEWEVVRADS